VARTPIKNRSALGKKLQQQVDEKDALDEGRAPPTMMGSAWGYNRPKRPSLIEKFNAAVKAAKLRRNPPPELKGAVDITDIQPRQGGKVS